MSASKDALTAIAANLGLGAAHHNESVARRALAATLPDGRTIAEALDDGAVAAAERDVMAAALGSLAQNGCDRREWLLDPSCCHGTFPTNPAMWCHRCVAAVALAAALLARLEADRGGT